MARRFTLFEAESLIPSVDPLLRKAIDLKSRYDQAERVIQAHTQRILLMGGLMVDRAPVQAARDRREQAAEKLREAIEEVQGYGCVVKDLETGLIDFPTLFRGREVYLCWKLGEPSIAFWHGMDEGFAGRKAIDQEFRDHHRGDRSQ